MKTQNAFDGLVSLLQLLYENREAQNIADWIVESVTGLKKWERKMDNPELTELQYQKIQQYSKELAEGKPVQYVLGEAWFCGLKFFVNESVLIPRPETEELVQKIVDEKKLQRHLSIIDIGTGSGCIPISLKKKLPDATILAVDVSDTALLTARQNADFHKTEITFRQLNFLNPEARKSMGTFDVIVSNPPYIPIAEKKLLAKNVMDFEPSVALFVPDNDPLIFYKAIEDFAGGHLSEEGKIYLEVHESHAHEVKDYFVNRKWEAEISKDIYGKERIVTATLS